MANVSVKKKKKCISCNDTSGKSSDWIGCSTCDKWFHRRCVYLDGLSEENVKHLFWSCRLCYDGFCNAMIELKRLKEQKEKIEKKLQLREERIAKLESEASIGVTDGMNTSLD